MQSLLCLGSLLLLRCGDYVRCSISQSQIVCVLLHHRRRTHARRRRGEAGTGKTVLLTELAWRALERGEHVIYAILENDPLAVLTRFK